MIRSVFGAFIDSLLRGSSSLKQNFLGCDLNLKFLHEMCVFLVCVLPFTYLVSRFSIVPIECWINFEILILGIGFSTVFERRHILKHLESDSSALGSFAFDYFAS